MTPAIDRITVIERLTTRIKTARARLLVLTTYAAAMNRAALIAQQNDSPRRVVSQLTAQANDASYHARQLDDFHNRQCAELYRQQWADAPARRRPNRHDTRRRTRREATR